jgi:integrase
MRNVDMIGLPRGGTTGSKAMSRSSAAANKEVKTLENCAKYDGVHGKTTKKDYLTEWVGLAKYLRNEHHVKIITENLTPEMISGYMTKRAAETNDVGTYAHIVSAVRKFGVAVDVAVSGKYGGYWSDVAIAMTKYNKADFTNDPDPKDLKTRAPNDPAAIIASDKLKMADKIAVRVSCELGCRLSETRKITVVDAPPPSGAEGTYLLSDNRLIWTAKGGQLMGGANRPRFVSPGLAQEIRAAAGEKLYVEVAESTLNRHLKAAAAAVGQKLKGAEHPFRHWFAREDLKMYMAQGLTYEQARQEVAEDLGHHRAYTTDRYLR